MEFLVDCRRIASATVQGEENARGMAAYLSDTYPGTYVAIIGAAGNVVDVYRDNKALGVTELPGDW